MIKLGIVGTYLVELSNSASSEGSYFMPIM